MAGKRTLVIDFIVDDKDARAALGRVDNSLGTTGKKFGGLAIAAKAALTGVAAKAVTDFALDMYNLGIQGDQIERRFDTVFGNMADAARQWADDNNEAFGVGMTDLQGMMSQVQDLLVPMGIARDEATNMTQTIIETSDALALWSGRDLSDTIDTIIGAMLGERERLKNLGIKISQADIDARLAAEGLDELEGAARRAAEAEATLSLIMEQSKDALQSYTQDGIDPAVAAQRDLIASWKDARQGVADTLLPALTDAAEGLVTIVGYVEALVGAIGDLIGWLDSLASKIGFLGDAGDLLKGFADTLIPGQPFRLGDALSGLPDLFSATSPTPGAVSGIPGSSSASPFGGGGGGLKAYGRGGIVPGPVGAPQLAVVHGGETITPPGQTGGLTINNLNVRASWDFTDPTVKRTIVTSIQDALTMYGAELGVR